MAERILLRCRDIPDLRKLAVYLQHGGYEAAKRALTQHTPEQLIEMVKASNLRGRGGAGFPTGMKWGFLPKQSEKPVYLCVNADESEPGTFKDRETMEDDPHQRLDFVAGRTPDLDHLGRYLNRDAARVRNRADFVGAVPAQAGDRAHRS